MGSCSSSDVEPPQRTVESVGSPNSSPNSRALDADLRAIQSAERSCSPPSEEVIALVCQLESGQQLTEEVALDSAVHELQFRLGQTLIMRDPADPSYQIPMDETGEEGLTQECSLFPTPLNNQPTWYR